MLYCVAIRVNIINAETQQTVRIHIIGLGAVAGASLSDDALHALQYAGLVIGSPRQLGLIELALQGLSTQPIQQPLPALSKLKALLEDSACKNVVVLASGDPLFYGIGRWFTKNFAAESLFFHPAVSSVQAACHALGLSLQDADVISLHGRPLEKIRATIQPQQTLIVLTDKDSTPQALAKECARAGFKQATLWVGEQLGYPQQKVRQFTVAELLNETDLNVDPLHVTVIKTGKRSGEHASKLGIEDHFFQTGKAAGTGMITKREVRLTVLSMMNVSNNDVIWDIGAGCGGVAVELAKSNERATVYAIEQHAQRLEKLKDNAANFGVSSNCYPIAGRVPEALADLPSPNKLFIGGSGGELETLLPMLWRKLPAEGLMVITAVTEQTKQQLEQFCLTLEDVAVECVELSVSRGELGNAGFSFNKKRPVMVLKLQKKAIS